jgi:hypothetical protein
MMVLEALQITCSNSTTSAYSDYCPREAQKVLAGIPILGNDSDNATLRKHLFGPPFLESEHHLLINMPPTVSIQQATLQFPTW